MKHLQFMNLVFGILAITACGGEPDPGNSNSEVGYFEGIPEPVDGTCTSVRLTTYEANGGGWCESSGDGLQLFIGCADFHESKSSITLVLTDGLAPWR